MDTESAAGADRVANSGTIRSVITLLVALEIVAAAVLVGYFVGHSGHGRLRQISVGATGTVRAKPDTFKFQIGVHTVSSNAAQATAINSAQIRRLEAALLRHGLTMSNLQTVDFSIYQNYCNASPCGFAVDNTLNVTVHKISTAGAAIQSAVAAGGNGVTLSGAYFSIGNPKKYQAQARIKAMNLAYNKAQQLAQGGHDSLGSIQTITENEGYYSPIYYGPVFAARALADSVNSPVPLAQGSQSISVSVTVVFALG